MGRVLVLVRGACCLLVRGLYSPGSFNKNMSPFTDTDTQPLQKRRAGSLRPSGPELWMADGCRVVSIGRSWHARVLVVFLRRLLARPRPRGT